MDLLKDRNQIILGTVIVVLAIAFLVVSDRRRRQKTDWCFVLLLLVGLPATLVAWKSGWFTADQLSTAVWVVGGLVLAIYLLTLIIVPVVALFSAWRKVGIGGMRSIQFLRHRGGKQIGRCDQCQSDVEFSAPAAGQLAYRCATCGNERHWQ